MQRHRSCLWMMCAPQGVPCRGGGWAVGALGGARSQERAVRMPCACRAIALPGFARHHDHRGWVASSWGSATQHGAGCGVQFVKEREPGSLELDARVQHALRMPSPLLLRRESAVVGRGHGQRTREWRWWSACRQPLYPLYVSLCKESPLFISPGADPA